MQDKGRFSIIKPLEATQASVETAVAQTTAIVPSPVVAPPAGSHTDWMAAAGIAPADYGYVDYIVSHESNWDPCAYNPGFSDCSASPSTACGLVQQNPCGKIPGNWTDPIAALIWQKQYVCEAKFLPYGGCYLGAYTYWLLNGNY